VPPSGDDDARRTQSDRDFFETPRDKGPNGATMEWLEIRFGAQRESMDEFAAVKPRPRDVEMLYLVFI